MTKTGKPGTLREIFRLWVELAYWRVLTFAIMMASLLLCALHPRRDDP